MALRLVFGIILALGGAINSIVAEGEEADKVARVGYLAVSLDALPDRSEAFRQGLRDLGYVEGRNVVIEYRDAEGKPCSCGRTKSLRNDDHTR